jgi:tetratricopeptide (TPR) repeat protein
MQNLHTNIIITTLLLVTLLLVGCTTANANPESDHDQAALPNGPQGDVPPVAIAPTLTHTAIPSLTPIPVPTETATATLPPTLTPEPTITPRPQPTEPVITVAEQRALATQATATAIANLAAQYADINALPARVEMPMVHEYQRLNNCAPTTTSMVMRFYGINVVQADMAALQKPIREDVNVTAEEVANSVREVGLEAYVGHSRDLDLVIRLLAAGFPIIAEEWIDHDEGMGHFRAIRGYDREQQRILYNDSFYGPGLWRSYDNFLRAWAPYNNKFVLPYRADQEPLVRALIGDQWEESGDYSQLLETTTAQVERNPADAYALWGQGEALVRLGRPQEAIVAFESAIGTGALPWRYLWYRYGYFEALNQVGRYEDLLAVSRTSLDQMKRSEDIRYHRAVAFVALGRTEEAITSLELALQDNPRFIPAQAMLAELGG